MNTVYAVYYDNNMDYEDHESYVVKIFSSEASAQAFVTEENKKFRWTPPTKEEFEQYANNFPEYATTYEDYCEVDMRLHPVAEYYVREYKLYP